VTSAAASGAICIHVPSSARIACRAGTAAKLQVKS
jgi:hypothetical protein